MMYNLFKVIYYVYVVNYHNSQRKTGLHEADLRAGNDLSGLAATHTVSSEHTHPFPRFTEGLMN